MNDPEVQAPKQCFRLKAKGQIFFHANILVVAHWLCYNSDNPNLDQILWLL